MTESHLTPAKCPNCGGPLEPLFFHDGRRDDDILACFNGCKYPRNRYRKTYPSGATGDIADVTVKLTGKSR